MPFEIDGKPYWHHYLEIGGELMPMDDLDVWTEAHYATDNQVALTRIDDETVVSTVFLGLNHSPEPGPPLIYETLLHGPEGFAPPRIDEYRYFTRAEAREGHEKVVADLKENG